MINVQQILDQTIDNMLNIIVNDIWPIFRPLIIGFIIGAIVIFIVRKLSGSYFLLTGSSKREARRKSKLLSEFIDWISSVLDIFKK